MRKKPNGVTRNGNDGPVVITGGAGFIGTNLAHRLLSEKRDVIVFDNLSRPGVAQNLEWLKETHGNLVQHVRGDVRDFKALRKVLEHASQLFHFAAQVAVTTSLNDPIEDFEINARGTLNILETLRSLSSPPPMVFTSTNKVYGDLKDVKLVSHGGRYEPEDEIIRRNGFDETRALHFHSPYGCSKGAACQYVQDYARTFGLATVVFRMSCIYGPHQFGTEDQGWVAHFLIRALDQLPITIYGDGCQVRDILFVEDLVNAFLAAQQQMPKIAGQVFNMGGGPAHTISLLELVEIIKELHGSRPRVRLDEWRLADQQYYVSDTRKFSTATGWVARVELREGIRRLYEWLRESRPVAVPSTSFGQVTDSPKREVLQIRPARVPTAARGKAAHHLRIQLRTSRNGKPGKLARAA